MCRWLAYSGAPIFLDEVLFKTYHSLIDQSLRAADSHNTTNGDGFGIGWYGARESPGVNKDIRPAWNDTNLQALATQIESSVPSRPNCFRLFTVQQTPSSCLCWH